MLIIGAKGLAKEVLEILHQKEQSAGLHFYDDVNTDVPDLLYDRFPVLRTEEAAARYFRDTDPRFILGVGGPAVRRKLAAKFEQLGGALLTVTSINADIGSFDNHFGAGCIVTSGCVITNSVTVGSGTLINLCTTVGHDTVIGSFAELCPNVSISGHCTIGDGVFIGTGATILPGITIGENSVVAAGATVTRDVPPYVMVAGAPAAVKKELR